MESDRIKRYDLHEIWKQKKNRSEAYGNSNNELAATRLQDSNKINISVI
jgi:hypothetical protein